jgi:OOP family OmpA-OmpF porin
MFGELNLDATLSLTNLFLKYDENRALDIYAFAGPTMNIASAVSGKTELVSTKTENGYHITTGAPTFESHGTKARLGATAGLGLDINLNNKWALNIESRFGVTPSIFGEGSDCRKAEATGRLTVGAKYTFGGKKFAKGGEAKIVEKVVEKEVIKEVPVEVVKEVIKEVPSAASAAIFFKIGKAVISPEGMVNVKLMAKTMKNNPTTKYKVAGFADKATGSVAGNQTLSEKRAQAVYDALIAEGISADRLEKVAMGGTDPIFEKGYLNRVVILEVK